MTSTGLRRRGLAWLLSGITLVAAPVALTSTANAQAPTFFGYSFLASADGVTQSGGDPSAQGYPQVQSRTAHTYALLETNENGRAIASSQYPGQFVAGGPQLLGVFSNDIPPQITSAQYPIQAQAASGAKSEDTQPGMTARIGAGQAEAIAESPAFEENALFSYGEIRTVSRSSLNGGVGTATATSTITDISFGGGQIHIDSVVTVAEVSTDGVTSTVRGSATVSGASVGGQPVRIDEDGVHAGDSQNPNPADAIAQALVDNVLTHFKDGLELEIYVSKPVQRNEGNIAEYVSGSLVVLMRAGDPGGQGGGLGAFLLGGSNSYVQAFPGSGPPPTSPPVTRPGIGTPSTQPVVSTTAAPQFGADTGRTTTPAPVAAPPTTTPLPVDEVAAPAAPTSLDTVPIVSRFEGLSFSLPLFVLLGSLAAGRGLVLFQRSLGGATAADCLIADGEPR